MIVDTKIIVDKTVIREKKVGYLPPSDHLQIPVMYMDLFPEVKIEITSLKSKNYTFINKPVTLLEYKHPGFNNLGDQDDWLRLTGEYYNN